MFGKLKSLVASAIASTMGMSFKAFCGAPKRSPQKAVPLFRKPVRGGAPVHRQGERECARRRRQAERLASQGSRN